MSSDTIAAIASGLSQSGIGVIRISGPEAVTVADRIFHMKGKTLADQETHTIHYGWIYDEEEKLDEGLAMIMRAPHSFTAEDVVEIQCHGGPLVMKRILQAIIHHGARTAEPGEFSKRAFLNGRMDLSQAEAVMDLIQAENEFALDVSVRQLSGSLSREIRSLRESILYEIAYMEAAMDDPEHISLDGYSEELSTKLDEMEDKIHHLIHTADNGKRLSEGIRTVILGRPNAGKSSLLNQLLGEERAIVTEVAGTTRDILEETVHLGGFSLRVIDTAGIRNTEDKVEKIGVERARHQAEIADLIIYVVDSSESPDDNDREILRMLKDKPSIILMNKTDLPEIQDAEKLKQETGLPVIRISAKEGTGIDRLVRQIEEMFDLGEVRRNDQVTITNIRHKEALLAAHKSIRAAMDSLEAGMPEDFLTIDLMEAYSSLGKILGETVEEDLVNEIFSKFCMGK